MLDYFWWGAAGSNNKCIRWLSWDKLSLRKEDGGLGFRNLYVYNLALLGKLGCKFMNNDDALVTRIFKSKYFPGGTFWT